MERFKGLFKRRPDRFIQLLQEQAEFTVLGMEALLSYLEKPSSKRADEVERLEKEADEVRRILIDELNRTFVTPMDREDIHALSRAIDDVLDYAYTNIGEMEILEVRPNDYMRRMVSLLVDAAREIHLGILRISDHPQVAEDHAVRAKALENRVEQVYREALANLFNGPRDVDHLVEMLKLREIYRHLSNAADRGDEAANVITDIVVKMAA
jgi:predicted phosphate transport protein (TIGR00153 family)